jgi:hypothetical protein
MEMSHGSSIHKIPNTLAFPARQRPISQVPPGDLDVAAIGQLPPTQLALGNPFEARALQMVGFKAALRGWALRQEALEHTPREPDNPLVLADAHAELDSL